MTQPDTPRYILPPSLVEEYLAKGGAPECIVYVLDKLDGVPLPVREWLDARAGLGEKL